MAETGTQSFSLDSVEFKEENIKSGQSKQGGGGKLRQMFSCEARQRKSTANLKKAVQSSLQQTKHDHNSDSLTLIDSFFSNLSISLIIHHLQLDETCHFVLLFIAFF